ncbi:MAG TPA: glycosyl hydrolase family 28-related protein [Burkholderiaceae bacterium]|nr:glycosyl hydrolase family 28-related protein [Burkholderiaceae bacterium]
MSRASLSKSFLRDLSRSSLIAASLVLAACGGGGGGGNAGSSSAVAPLGTSTDTNTAAASPESQAPVTEAFDDTAALTPLNNDQIAALATAAACEVLPAMPALASNYRSVLEFGAVPNDENDDSAAIQRAVNALQPGQTLVFPAGRYIHNKAIWVRVPGAILWSQGATLHATNPSDQAILLAASGASIYGFTMTAVTQNRRSTPWESRIAIFADVRNTTTSKNNVIRRNKIIAGAPGTPTANGASSAGIFVYQAENFLIAENEVHRTLSDGIHITRGSFNGRVLYNKVRETGDDMIGIVSQIAPDWLNTSAATYSAELTQRAQANTVHDIVVAYNDVAGQYWGRGISVVGGRGITIRDNVISDTTHAAAIYLAREPGYVTFGVHNVLVKNNTIRRVQTTKPVYDPFGKYSTTLQGGIEMYAQVFDDEAVYSNLRSELRVERVRIEGNLIDGVINNSVRANSGFKDGARTMTGTNSAGQTVSRLYRTVIVGPLDVRDNKMYNTGIGPALRFLGNVPAPVPVYCSGNTYNDAATSHPMCTTAPITVTGAALTCS